MDKVKELFNKTLEGFKKMGKIAKICIIVAAVAIIIGLCLAIFYSFSNKYKVLFTGLEPKDAQMVTEKLKEMKVDLKIENDTILVPKDDVDSLRLELAPNLSGGSVGYELMDEGSSFGITSEEFALKKLRMTQGEIEKTIKSFPQIENARVHITLPKDTVFVDEKEEGSAAAYIQLAADETLDEGQVKSIVALIASSVDRIPKEKVEVIDQNMKLLSEGLFKEGNEGMASSGEAIANQKKLEADYELKLEKSVYELLNPVLGSDKIKTQINVELDFDSEQKTQVTVDPEKVIKNQTTIKESSDGSSISTGPVDDNMTNNIDDESIDGSGRYEQSTEYELGKTEVKNISAPGEVKRVTASVVVDGNLSAQTKTAVQNLVSTAIGFKQDRGDEISVVSMAFNSEAKDAAKEQIELMKSQAKTEKIIRIAVMAIIVVAIIALLVLLIIRFKNKEQEEEIQEERSLNVVIDDTIMQSFDPIDFDIKDEKTHVESEIKNYATKKPEQVADVIKSWLNEDER